MKKQIISLLIIIFSLTSFQTLALDQNWKPAQDGDKIILIRHAKAPGGGDPEGFKIDDCKTQRNLDMMGINQAKKIGKLFREKKVKINQVLSSHIADDRIIASQSSHPLQPRSVLLRTVPLPVAALLSLPPHILRGRRFTSSQEARRA